MAIKQTMHIFGIFLVMLVVGCATGISQQSRSKVTYMGKFSELQKTPDAYVSEVVMLGGKILEIKVSSTSSELTVLQLALGRSDRPANLDQSEGRFLVRSEQFLDPATIKEEIDFKKYENIKVVDYAVSDLIFSEDKINIIQTIEIQYYWRDNYVLKSIQDKQYWRYYKEDKIWLLQTCLPFFKQ